jgi:hypothetical protein
MQTLTTANFEKLSTSLDAYNRANVQHRLAPDSIGAANASIRAYNVLLDLCLSLGMDHVDEPDLWAAGRVGRWLRAA